MYSRERLYERYGPEGLPFTIALSTPTELDVEAILNRADGLVYRPDLQRNEGTEPSMGYSTCSRRSSTGLIFTDNDRTRDD
jgi:hypothetical protein